MNWRTASLIAVLLIATGLMLWSRFDIVPIGHNRIAHLDRLTGDVTICDETGCVKPGELKQPALTTGDPNSLIKAWDEDQAAKRAAKP